MGRAIWIFGATVMVALVIGAITLVDGNDTVKPVALTEPVVVSEPMVLSELSDPTQLEDGNIGSAIATAAFGLSALQPETFNSQIVRDIIEASPLGYGEKDRLTAKLMAAEAGHAELPRVLADIRTSLAVE